MPSLVRSAALTLLLVLVTGTARGDDLPDPNPAHPGNGWYGWKILLADGAVAGATGLCVAAGLEDPCWVPLSGYLFASPIIHGVHRGPLRAIASVALRLSLPILGYWIGSKIPDCSINNYDGNCGLGESLFGAALGATTAVAIDSVWAFDDPSARAAVPSGSRAPGFSAMPAVSLMARGAGVGLAGRF
jgi:hypothetical protein